jgi:oxalate decarboxylase/phosphoglucose isomerase-like protein (cupin superfamily)
MSLNIRRIVTGHNADGKAVVLKDDRLPTTKLRSGNDQSLVWMTEDCPAVIKFENDPADAVLDIEPPERGTVFRVLEVMPGKEAYMHVTQTIDYAMVLDGQATMLLDDSEVVLEQGDVLVQRATNHGWTNRSDKPCRIAFVLIGAQPA